MGKRLNFKSLIAKISLCFVWELKVAKSQSQILDLKTILFTFVLGQKCPHSLVGKCFTYACRVIRSPASTEREKFAIKIHQKRLKRYSHPKHICQIFHNTNQNSIMLEPIVQSVAKVQDHQPKIETFTSSEK